MPETVTTENNSPPQAPRVTVHLPCEVLRECITFYYFVTTEGPVTDFLYPEWGNVRFSLSGDWHVSMEEYGLAPQIDTLFGPTDRCALFRTSSGRCAGFGLTPIGWLQLMEENADLMRNRVRPLQSELGPPSSEVHSRLLGASSDEEGVAIFDQILTDLFSKRPPLSPLFISIDHALRDRPISVEQFAAAVSMSPRTLQRLCLKLYGFSPKRLLRRQRFMDTLGKIRTAVGEALHEALDPEYFDQAHFYRDFRAFMGMSPRAYFNASRAVMEKAARAQKDAGVTLSFKLPPTVSRTEGRSRKKALNSHYA